MEIKNEGKIKRGFKKFGVLGLACVFSLAIALTLAFCLPNDGVEVSTAPISFTVPMKGAVVTKDFADDRLQHNESLKRWEIHLAVDLASEDSTVMSIYDGVVQAVDSDSLEGNYIKIAHENGFVSVYSSLSDDIKVKVGESVKKGQEIGKASDSASNESKAGGHLHFTLFKDGLEVDPNNYLDLQNK